MTTAHWRDPETGREYRFVFEAAHAGEGTTVQIHAGGQHVGKTVLFGTEEARYRPADTGEDATLADWQARELLGRAPPR